MLLFTVILLAAEYVGTQGIQDEKEVQCALPHIRPPCHHFDVIKSDLEKWANRSLVPSLVDVSTDRLFRYFGKHDVRKSTVMGAWGDVAWHLYPLNSSKASSQWPNEAWNSSTPPVRVSPHSYNDHAFLHFRRLAQRVSMDIEFRIFANDQGFLGRPKFVTSTRNRRVKRKIGACAGFPLIFSSLTDPQACDVAFPAGALRPTQPKHLMSPEVSSIVDFSFLSRSVVEDSSRPSLAISRALRSMIIILLHEITDLGDMFFDLFYL
jgi:hypothetical protein